MSETEIQGKRVLQKIGWSGIIYILVFLAIVCYIIVRKNGRRKEPVYTKGVIVNIDTGVHGHLRLNYVFMVGGRKHHNSVATAFCNECDSPCCHPGDSVLVIYQRSNPDNNDLLHHLPPNAVLIY